MRAIERDVIAQTRFMLWNRSGGRCEVCGKRLDFETFQMAHRIPQRKWLLKKYGKSIIHHPKNLAATCSLRCNGAVSIAGNPVAMEQLAQEISEELNV